MYEAKSSSRVSDKVFLVQRRVKLWLSALTGFLASPPEEKLFELLETGEIIPWEILKGR